MKKLPFSKFQISIKKKAKKIRSIELHQAEYNMFKWVNSIYFFDGAI